MKTKNIYRNLREEMAYAGVTVLDLAKAIGVDRTTVSNKITGKYDFRLGEAAIIARDLFEGKTVEYLFAEAFGREGA